MGNLDRKAFLIIYILINQWINYSKLKVWIPELIIREKLKKISLNCVK